MKQFDVHLRCFHGYIRHIYIYGVFMFTAFTLLFFTNVWKINEFLLLFAQRDFCSTWDLTMSLCYLAFMPSGRLNNELNANNNLTILIWVQQAIVVPKPGYLPQTIANGTRTVTNHGCRYNYHDTMVLTSASSLKAAVRASPSIAIPVVFVSLSFSSTR